jgi:hypothetical protein
VKELTTQPDVTRMSDIELGKILGERKAFGLVAGRCSAAQAAALKKIKDEKAYECVAPTWDEFCTRELRMSRVHANRIIHWFEEFGQAYFEMVQLAPVSPEEYRALAPVIVDHKLQLNGQSIALIPEKAEEVASAISELRKAARANKPRVSTRKRIASLEKQCHKLTAEFEDLSGQAPEEERNALSAILLKILCKLGRIEREM